MTRRPASDLKLEGAIMYNVDRISVCCLFTVLPWLAAKKHHRLWRKIKLSASLISLSAWLAP